ncbi:alkaline phosphatase family protein [Streptomyces sp. SID8382]|uniref:alkaline phosphatase D family protein n=1 Tax=Streptomyces malaysiensis TaxID=92644 RepID=UPI000C2C990E|nr:MULTISPECIES: alkaline phosphatase D family protein [unclassified Streptomyces]AUA14152.1 PhoD-like phosphatase [Streptomyces sp. M56]MYX58102.1 alkaline phosphatase family protein [Streptomyces sp. SID8382]
MAGLRLGPLLRHVDWETGTGATVWVEADRPCEAEVRCADGAGGTARTWRIAGHHYALIPVAGLRPGGETAYRVLLDGEQVWPLPDSPFPDSTIRTPAPGTDSPGPAPVRVAFGSCRWAAPPSDASHDPVGPDALDTLAQALARAPELPRPDVLVLLGDQVYADETSAETRAWLAERRDLSEPPGEQVADYEEYTRLYYESWLDPEVRWLLSTVPSCMIFDDHDVIDDWNTSEAWQRRMRATPWWRERILSGLMSYWVHQHLGNLSPAELAADPLYAEVRAAEDGTEALREFAARADADPAYTRWSYRRDFGRTRLLMVDTRAARVLEEGRRAMLTDKELIWVREQAMDGLGGASGFPGPGPEGPGAPGPEEPGVRGPEGPGVRGGYDHLLLGTSLPWLLPHFVHDVEAWNASVCGGRRGGRWARISEDLRQRGDLEHWAAFPESFDALTDTIAAVGGAPGAPATINVLSGDVHHAYVATPDWSRWPSRPPRSQVRQLTCSPVHNSIYASIRLGFRFGWSAAGRALGRVFKRHGRVPHSHLSWHKTGGPWFGNQLMTLTLQGRSAHLRLDQAQSDPAGGGARLVAALETDWAG